MKDSLTNLLSDQTKYEQFWEKIKTSPQRCLKEQNPTDRVMVDKEPIFYVILPDLSQLAQFLEEANNEELRGRIRELCSLEEQ